MSPFQNLFYLLIQCLFVVWQWEFWNHTVFCLFAGLVKKIRKKIEKRRRTKNLSIQCLNVNIILVAILIHLLSSGCNFFFGISELQKTFLRKSIQEVEERTTQRTILCTVYTEGNTKFSRNCTMRSDNCNVRR